VLVGGLQSGMPYVYLLRCGDGTLYAGAAKDLARRLAEHRAGLASRYTRGRLPVELVWWLQVESWGDALRAEIRLKRLPRAGKDELLRAGLPEPCDAPPG
jgi:putative endonuclease